MTEYGVPGISISGQLLLKVSLKIKEITTGTFGGKRVVITYQKGDYMATESLAEGDILTITYPVNAHNGDPKAEETVRKMKDVLRDLA